MRPVSNFGRGSGMQRLSGTQLVLIDHFRKLDPPTPFAEIAARLKLDVKTVAFRYREYCGRADDIAKQDKTAGAPYAYTAGKISKRTDGLLP